MSKTFRYGFAPSSFLLAVVLFPAIALAQSGSAGGSIGNDDKSLSGSRQDRTAEPAQRSKPAADESRSSSQRSGGSGGNLDGAWSYKGTSTNCGGTGGGSFVVSGRRVIISGGAGSVSSSGAFQAVGIGNDGVRVSATGRLSGASGGGSYRRSDGCVGRWIASRH